ncbi:putative odorant-binding protein A10 [Toxorhynchites rutilus septentrionalis]|uniref:putative odorant-binding protein A10 n=1 Tax=Toxorhynchites rutilus septentrionalis TaxID=329112 RepID=UPI00247A5B4F|nr:putative odorant-binding protein A10 [Toxorhynchites rutilus septentrionalis]
MLSKVTAMSHRSTALVALFFLFSCLLAVQEANALPQSVTVATTPKPQVSDEALEKALSDKRYLQRQLKCALGEVPCDPVGKRLKSLAPLVLRGACPQCTPMETLQIKKTLAHLQRHYPVEWNKLVQTYAG